MPTVVQKCGRKCLRCGDQRIAALLAMLAASMAGLWLIATARHTVASGNQSPSRHPVKTA
jgi:hypothetical protein